MSRSPPYNLVASLKMLIHASCGILGYLRRTVLLNYMLVPPNPFSDVQGLKHRGSLEGKRMVNPPNRSRAGVAGQEKLLGAEMLGLKKQNAWLRWEATFLTGTVWVCRGTRRGEHLPMASWDKLPLNLHGESKLGVGVHQPCLVLAFHQHLVFLRGFSTISWVW